MWTDKLPDDPTISRLKLRGPGRPSTDESGEKLEKPMLCSGKAHSVGEEEEHKLLKSVPL